MDAQNVERGVMPCSLGGLRLVDTAPWPRQTERADGEWKYPQLASLHSHLFGKNALQGRFPIWLGLLGFQPHLDNLLAPNTVSVISRASYK